MSKSNKHFPDFHILASAGKIEGITPFFKFGRNQDVDTGTVPEDVHSLGGTKLFPLAASTISIVSTDANDTDGGTGVHNAFISGLDSNYNLLVEEVRLNGVTPVVTTGSFLRVDRMYSTEAGSNVDAIGSIIATHSEGAIASIAAGESQSLIGCYTVPANHTLLLSNLFIGLTKKTSAAQGQVHFEARFFGQDTYRAQQVVTIIAEGSSSISRDADPMWFPIPEKTDIRLRVHDISVNDTGIVGAFDGYLINNKTFSY